MLILLVPKVVAGLPLWPVRRGGLQPCGEDVTFILYPCTLVGNKIYHHDSSKFALQKPGFAFANVWCFLRPGLWDVMMSQWKPLKAKRRKRQGIHVVEARSLLSCLTRRTFYECFSSKQFIDFTRLLDHIRSGRIHLVCEFQELSSGKMVGLLGALATLAAFAFSSDQARSLGSERVFSSNLSWCQRQNEAYAPVLVLD